MLTRDDLIDIVVSHLVGEPGKGAPQPKAAEPGGSRAAEDPKKPAERRNGRYVVKSGLPPPGPIGKLFLSEYDLKKRLTPGTARLTIPKGAIVSPLAQDWLTLKGIEVVQE